MCMNIWGKIFRKVRSAKRLLETNLFYGAFGNKSKIIKPMRILGKRYMFIGNRVNILNSARIEAVYEYQNQKFNPKLVIGDGTTIGQCCHIIAANELTIGNNCMFSAFIYISDCNHTYIPGANVNETALEVKKTRIGDGCFIGIGARIMPGVTLGNNCVVGANAVVTHDVPERAVVAGVPAKIIRYL